MDTLGFKQVDKWNIYKIISSILLLGNIQFLSNPNKPGQAVIQNAQGMKIQINFLKRE